MAFDGLHHVTGITGDGQANVDFYVGLLGLRLVKRTVNHNDALTLHLFSHLRRPRRPRPLKREQVRKR